MSALSSSRTCARTCARPARGAVVVRAASNAFSRTMRSAGQAAATIALSAGLMVAPAFADGVLFSNVKSGANVASPVHLEFSVQGMAVKPAAEGLIPGTGHFHVLIDEKATPEEGETIAFNDTHKHYGKGQLTDDLALSPGKHTLSLVFANSAHMSYGPSYTQIVSVDVQK